MFKRGLEPSSGLGLGNLYTPYMTQHQRMAIKKMVKYDNDIIVCGSAGLAINGLLKRDVKDIDILINYDAYHNPDLFFPDYRINNEADSQRFMMHKSEVISFKLKMGDVMIDVLHNPSREIKYDYHGFYGYKLKVEHPSGAINAKLDYVANDLKATSFRKHLMDLLNMDIDRGKIIKALEISKNRFIKLDQTEVNISTLIGL